MFAAGCGDTDYDLISWILLAVLGAHALHRQGRVDAVHLVWLQSALAEFLAACLRNQSGRLSAHIFVREHSARLNALRTRSCTLRQRG